MYVSCYAACCPFIICTVLSYTFFSSHPSSHLLSQDFPTFFFDEVLRTQNYSPLRLQTMTVLALSLFTLLLYHIVPLTQKEDLDLMRNFPIRSCFLTLSSPTFSRPASPLYFLSWPLSWTFLSLAVGCAKCFIRNQFSLAVCMLYYPSFILISCIHTCITLLNCYVHASVSFTVPSFSLSYCFASLFVS